jgi:general secretion pathway protein G
MVNRNNASGATSVTHAVGASTTRYRGFTLIELLVVLAIVAMLLSLAAPRYFKSVDHAKHTLLVDNLRQTREIIDKFYSDTGRYPESLDELVDKAYLKATPIDPVTGSATTWILVSPRIGLPGKVFNIRSGAPGTDRFGRPLNEL